MTRLVLTSTAIAVGLVGLIAVAGASCGGGGNGAEERAPTGAAPKMPSSPSDAACGAIPGSIRGKWVVTIEPDDLLPEIADTRTGTSPLQLGPGHRATLWGGKPHGVDNSPACVVGNRIRFAYDTCFGNEGPGIYDWQLEGGELVFEKVYDNCPYRAFHMTVHPWKRVG